MQFFQPQVGLQGSVITTITFLDLRNHDIVDPETLVVRIAVQIGPHTNRQRHSPSPFASGQRDVTACDPKGFFLEHSTAQLLAVRGENVGFGPARLAVDRDVGGLVVPEGGQ